MAAPRWKCPRCGSTEVQVSYPTWFHEDDSYDLKMVEPDQGADILWWYCDVCDESDSGRPEENT